MLMLVAESWKVTTAELKGRAEQRSQTAAPRCNEDPKTAKQSGLAA